MLFWNYKYFGINLLPQYVTLTLLGRGAASVVNIMFEYLFDYNFLDLYIIDFSTLMSVVR